MSTFKVPVEVVTIEPHPNADALEIASIQGFQAIVKKGQFESGQLVAYIPEAAIVPDDLLESMGLKGALHGPDKNRVKAIRLRGVVSQGLVYPVREGWAEGQDVAEELGITKWDPCPALPDETEPRARRQKPLAKAYENTFSVGASRTIRYDIENYKAHAKRDILQDGELVTYTEKIHGSWVCFALLPKGMAHAEYGDFIVTSKGLAKSGQALRPDVEGGRGNWYWRAARELGVEARMRKVWGGTCDLPVFLMGEVFGEGVQDLTYSTPLTFRAFDIYIGNPSPDISPNEMGEFCGHYTLETLLGLLELPRVPVLYCGPFSVESMRQYTRGTETVSGKGAHIREGIVVRPVNERTHPAVGRVIFKSVSEDYLLRKGGTEYQ